MAELVYDDLKQEKKIFICGLSGRFFESYRAPQPTRHPIKITCGRILPTYMYYPVAPSRESKP